MEKKLQECNSGKKGRLFAHASKEYEEQISNDQNTNFWNGFDNKEQYQNDKNAY